MNRKRIKSWSLAALLVVLFVFQAAAQDKVDLQVLQRIRQEGLEGGSKVMEYLSWLSDVYAPRLSESPQYREAGKWVIKTLTELGLVNAAMEPYGEFGRSWELQKFYAAMTAPQYMPLIAYPKAWIPGTNGPIKGNAVLLAVSKVEDLEKYKGKLSGAIVLPQGEAEVGLDFAPEASRLTETELEEIAQAAPPSGGRSPYADRMVELRARRRLQQATTKFLRGEGVAVVLEPSRGSDGTVFVSRGGSQNVKATMPLSSVVVAAEHYNRLVRILQKDIPVALEIEIEARFTDEDTKGYNVIAEIPGTDPKLKDEIVMLGGHFDTWHAGTGATDNGAGCAISMEAVRILKAIGVKPRRTIRIALWDAEEQGFIGSRGYVKAHFYDRTKKDKKPEYDKFSVYFNFDNGSGKIRGIYTQGNIAAAPIFESWLEPLHDLGASTVTSRNTGGTDHLSFDGAGLPGFQFIQDELDYGTITHHSNMDVVDHASGPDLMQASTVMAWFIYNAAMRDEKIPREYFNPAAALRRRR
ncbi:M20/M25/M40 family metallo-hydrolase [Acidobacteriota bacterium]